MAYAYGVSLYVAAYGIWYLEGVGIACVLARSEILRRLDRRSREKGQPLSFPSMRAIGVDSG